MSKVKRISNKNNSIKVDVNGESVSFNSDKLFSNCFTCPTFTTQIEPKIYETIESAGNNNKTIYTKPIKKKVQVQKVKKSTKARSGTGFLKTSKIPAIFRHI